ncbi:Acetyltransferase YpeA [Shewanella putrefaciens]|uniref:GNAT family N-acetyltransferase n=1 Tax=Shewanella putrefaciens TaxID=24 RepID=UPI000DF9200C|nr:GNAT family N-acetyltransferase [Shewanella putrefaciens]SUI86756.1 Acetyltransferase YpeA [Shewanella putrefaciens]
MSKFKIRVLESEDWQLYKMIRLCSLKESPDSFGATYEQESLLSDSEWFSRFQPNSDVEVALPLIAETDGHVLGLAWGLIHKSDVKTAHIYQMWVLPEARGKGVASKLLDEIKAWALNEKCSSIALSVTASNTAAVGLYRTRGFITVGQLEELRAGSGLYVQPMIMSCNAA